MLMIRNNFICGLVAGLFIVGCGKNQEQPEYVGKEDSAIEMGSSIAEEGSKMMQQAKEKASQIKESMSEQVEGVITKSSEMMEQAKPKLESMKDKTSSIIKELIARAYALLDQGKFKEAIASAQNVLSDYDSSSLEAKGIITKAKEKLKAMVTEKAAEELEATATERVEDVKDDITNKLKGFGK